MAILKNRGSTADRWKVQPLVSAVKGLKEQSRDLDLLTVLPVFLPRSIIESPSWTGPFATLRVAGVAMAWAVAESGRFPRYITPDKQQQWDSSGVDWRTQALLNLHSISGDALGTGALYRDSGEPWLISLMYPDGLGPSRLLLTDHLARTFPRGYRVALPEQNRAYAFTTELDREDVDTVENLVHRSYQSAEQPLSPGIFDPGDLAEGD